MVISYVRRFLFVHVYKAAGMSIEAALKPYDVRTPLRAYSPEEQRRLLLEIGLDPALLEMQRHVFARDVQKSVGADFFAKLFKFAFVRNPWDLQLSLFHFNLTHPEFPAHRKAVASGTFEKHILGMTREPHPVGQQRQFLVDADGNSLVDFVGRFETLATDFAHVCTRIGLSGVTLDHVNRTDHAPWTKSYTRPMFEIVRSIYRRDIEAFAYADDPAAYGVD
jgi:hypothetical protein